MGGWKASAVIAQGALAGEEKCGGLFRLFRLFRKKHEENFMVLSASIQPASGSAQQLQ